MRQNDSSLVAQVLAGDKASFGSLVVRHQSRAMRLALRMLGERADAEDVVQEALLQAFLQIRVLRAPDRFGAWLLGIVVNLCRMRLRNRMAGDTGDDWSGGRVPAHISWVNTQPSPEMMYEVRALHQVVLDAIATLPVAQQEAVRLYYFEGFKLKEISVLRRTPLGTVKAHLHRARSQLRQTLGREGQEVGISDPQGIEEIEMIEVTVHDVMLWVAKHEEVHWPGARQDYNSILKFF